jgi:hypothetical protein
MVHGPGRGSTRTGERRAENGGDAPKSLHPDHHSQPPARAGGSRLRVGAAQLDHARRRGESGPGDGDRDAHGSLTGIEHVYYGTHKLDSTPGIDYLNVGGLLLFQPGQQTATFTIPIIPHDWTGPAAHVAVYLYSSWPDSLGQNNATLAIVHDAPTAARDAQNPLKLSPAPTDGNLLAGARFYADRVTSPAAKAMLADPSPRYAAALSFIANQPWADRFGGWNGPDPARRCSPT